MSERVQQLLWEVRRAAQTTTQSQSPEDAALRARFPGAGQRSLDAVKQEIAKEIAFSLGRAGRKVESSICILEGVLVKARDSYLTGSEVATLKQEFLAERRKAERALRDLLIQREALGLRQHAEVKSRYRIPDWK